jgi:hypothetical protein
MRNLLAILAATLALVAVSVAQTTFGPVQHSNGVVIRPTNFNQANASNWATAIAPYLTNLTGGSSDWNTLSNKPAWISTNADTSRDNLKAATGNTNRTDADGNIPAEVAMGLQGDVGGENAVVFGWSGTGTNWFVNTNYQSPIRSALGLGASWLTNPTSPVFSATVTNITSATNSVVLPSARSLDAVISVGGSWSTNTITLATNSPQHGDIARVVFLSSSGNAPANVVHTGGLGGPWSVYVGNEARWVYDTNIGPPRWQPLGRTVRSQITYLGDTPAETRGLLGLGSLATNNSVPSGGAALGDVLQADGAQGSSFSPLQRASVFVFTPTNAPSGATGVTNTNNTQVTWTWTPPTHITQLHAIVVSPGGGGGSGRRGATNTHASGGGGGGGGSIAFGTFVRGDGPLTVTVGRGGAGGASQTTNDSNGLPGAQGFASSIAWTNGLTLRTGNANAGNGGTTTGAAATPLSGPGMYVGSIGQAALTNSENFTGDASVAGGNAGGSAGGSVTVSNTTIAGSGARIGTAVVASSYGVSAGPHQNGSNGVSATNSFFGNGGGGGGGPGVTNNAGNGAKPVGWGGGGGGGGGSRNGFNSGAGGQGGDGVVQIIAW